MNERTITHIDRSNCSEVAQEIIDAVNKAFEGTGMIVEQDGGVTYGKDEMTFKVSASVGMTPGERQYRSHCDRLDLPADAFGKEITIGGTTLKIVGLNPRASKNTVRLETLDGKIKVGPAELVRMALQKAEAAAQ